MTVTFVVYHLCSQICHCVLYNPGNDNKKAKTFDVTIDVYVLILSSACGLIMNQGVKNQRSQSMSEYYHMLLRYMGRKSIILPHYV